jgi:hypothetical protein
LLSSGSMEEKTWFWGAVTLFQGFPRGFGVWVGACCAGYKDLSRQMLVKCWCTGLEELVECLDI